jgi:hypothetical protein
MRRTNRAVIAAAVALTALAAVGCAAPAQSASSGRQSAGDVASASAATHASFVGYKWLVTSITSHGHQTLIPNRDLVNQVYVMFTPSGQFAADDPINIYEGTYRLVGNGFTTIGPVMGSAVGYAGDNPVTLLAINAISAFTRGVHETATVTGDRLDILVDGYLLNCERDGPSWSSVFSDNTDTGS